jgi:hypothetical protein
MANSSSIIKSERGFWEKAQRPFNPKATDEQISAKYDSKSERIVTETNREKLQNFYEALGRPNYMDPRPSYQRRQRWTSERQSQLIESFLINIPIPPLFVYESKPNVYEVMDGQQRITAIKAFYSNELVLVGLERWPELNGRTYSKLPERIRSGIDRRSISWITVLNESSESEEDAFSIKQLVFERLNTGGVKLSHQEIRNALHAGLFNDLLIRLSKNADHRAAWQLPEYTAAEEEYVPEGLADSNFYLEMQDVEVILRFFALRHADNYMRGMRGFLDIYMEKAAFFDAKDIVKLQGLYIETIHLAREIFGSYVFRPYVKRTDSWGAGPQKAYADAVMVALADNIDNAGALVECKETVLELTKHLFVQDDKGVLTGRGNTKADVINRIQLMRDLFSTALLV